MTYLSFLVVYIIFIALFYCQTIFHDDRKRCISSFGYLYNLHLYHSPLLPIPKNTEPNSAPGQKHCLNHCYLIRGNWIELALEGKVAWAYSVDHSAWIRSIDKNQQFQSIPFDHNLPFTIRLCAYVSLPLLESLSTYTNFTATPNSLQPFLSVNCRLLV